MGSYKPGYRSPNMGYKYSYPTYVSPTSGKSILKTGSGSPSTSRPKRSCNKLDTEAPKL